MSSLLSLAVAAVTLGAVAIPAPVLWGPPAICHPLDIGTATSLPWGQGAFDVDDDYNDDKYEDDRLLVDTRRLLRESDNLVEHMETLRRSVIYITGIARRESPSEDERTAAGARLVALLEADLDAASDGLAAEERGILEFDVGYALAALSQAGARQPDDGLTQLSEAARLRPEDPAVHLGYAIATCGHGDATRECYVHLDQLLEALDGSPAHDQVMANTVRVIGSLLDAEDRSELAALVDRKLGKA